MSANRGRWGRRLGAVFGAVLWLAAGSPVNASPAAPGFEVWHQPPGLILRGEPAVARVEWQTTDGGDPTEAYVFVRDDAHASFTRLRLFDGGTHRTIPAKFLTGRYVEDYVVLHDSGTSAVRRVPATGAFRSFIRDSFHTIALGKHSFGHLRRPDAVVARASVGDGPHQIAWFCPPEGLCEYPWSFDVGPHGEVWMVDPHHERVVGWFPKHPEAPSRSFPIDFGPADIAVGANGVVYVSGVKLGDPVHRMALYAFKPDGTLLWRSHMITQVFNDHIRFGPAGILYCACDLFGWVPVVDGAGKPLRIDQQRRLARPDQPVDGGLRLISRIRSQHEQRAGLATVEGTLLRAWRITSDTPMGDFGGFGTPAAVEGDPILDATVFDFAHHRFENVILRLSKDDGLARKFSLGEGIDQGADVTMLRVGYDGDLYQLTGNEHDGVTVARYSL